MRWACGSTRSPIFGEVITASRVGEKKRERHTSWVRREQYKGVAHFCWPCRKPAANLVTPRSPEETRCGEARALLTLPADAPSPHLYKCRANVFYRPVVKRRAVYKQLLPPRNKVQAHQVVKQASLPAPRHAGRKGGREGGGQAEPGHRCQLEKRKRAGLVLGNFKLTHLLSF